MFPFTGRLRRHRVTAGRNVRDGPWKTTVMIDVVEAHRQLVNLRASMPWAWAMGNPCEGGKNHPVLRAAREHENYLLAIIAEHRP